MDDNKDKLSYNLPISSLVKSENVDDLSCLICLGICFRPILLSCCEHLICLECVKQYVLKSSFCPYCKNTNLDFALPSKLVSRFFDNLIFYCPFKKSGCSEQVRYNSYFEHLTTCTKVETNSIYTKLNFCKSCFLLYRKESEHSCKVVKQTEGEEHNKFLNKLIILENKQNVNSQDTKDIIIDGIKIPNNWDDNE